MVAQKSLLGRYGFENADGRLGDDRISPYKSTSTLTSGMDSEMIRDNNGVSVKAKAIAL